VNPVVELGRTTAWRWDVPDRHGIGDLGRQVRHHVPVEPRLVLRLAGQDLPDGEAVGRRIGDVDDEVGLARGYSAPEQSVLNRGLGDVL